MSDQQVFLSHAHADNALCEQYYRALMSRGYDVWFDRANLQGGSVLSQEIAQQLQSRSVFIVMLTPSSVDSYWVELEVSAYRDLAAHDRSRLLLPVRALPCEIPLLLRGTKVIDAYDQPFDVAINAICDVIEDPFRRTVKDVPPLPRLTRRTALLVIAGGVVGVAGVVGTSAWVSTILPGSDRKLISNQPTPTLTPAPTATPTAPPSGTLLWRIQANGLIDAPPAVAGDGVYFGSFDGMVYAVDAASGSTRWQYQTHGQIHGTLAVADGHVYVGSDDKTLYAIELGNGNKSWSYAAPAPINSSPVADNALVYFGCDDNQLRALYEVGGEFSWSCPCPGSTASPVIDTHLLYIGDNNGGLTARDPHTGQVKWQKGGTGIVYGPIALSNGAVFVGTTDMVYGFNGTSGAELWHYQPAAEVFSGVAAADGLVYFSAILSPYVVALIAETGNLLWRYKAPSGMDFWTPTIANGVVYSGNEDGYLYAIDAKTGELKWQYEADGGLGSGVNVANGVVYFGTNSGSVYAVRA
ncbi:MAG TPA: toll/interleukin-1 receptor domain-containing protein [Ktedonobacterales bacterium]|nr:toll/interleukin-1 receptor domain-containing protein [Ktedonobacterales bacterium]